MNEELVIELINSLMYVALTVILPILTVYAVKIIRAKLTQIRYESMEQMHMDWVVKAMSIVEDIVVNVQQTFVDSLKAKGEFTPEAAKEAKDKAVALANELIADEIKNIIETIYSSYDKWLDVQIEKNVKQNK